jgi:hypothetical protein
MLFQLYLQKFEKRNTDDTDVYIIKEQLYCIEVSKRWINNGFCSVAQNGVPCLSVPSILSVFPDSTKSNRLPMHGKACKTQNQ